MISLQNRSGISENQLKELLQRTLVGKSPKKVLLLPPDFTRMYSFGGKIAAIYHDLLSPTARVDIMPTLGTHEPMSREECDIFFEGRAKHEDLIIHDWRNDVVKIGEVPGSFVNQVSEGLVSDKIDVEVNRRIVSGEYDLIISMGQVVPHEVVGMANYSKNIFVGCGGSSMISGSHMLGAFYGLERMMGRDFSPVRKVFDYAQEHFLSDVPLMYVLTVTEGTTLCGLFAEEDVTKSARGAFEQAVALSQELNIIRVEKPIQKAVVYLDPREFKSTWLGNKAVYRTRMAMAEGGELIILAPGIVKFGEDAQNDCVIRHHGYLGRQKVLEMVKESEELAANLSVAAHLIHGSSDGHFSVTYAAPNMTRDEIEGVGYIYGDYEALAARYDAGKLTDGYQTLPDGEEIYFISNPALGLWQA